MSPAKGERHSPVQIQKLLFLLDQEIPDLIGGRHFKFKPYHYGPFDRAVYSVLGELAKEGKIHISVLSGDYHNYSLTPSGLEEGEGIFKELSEIAQDYIQRCSEFVRSHDFPNLVAAIYKAYPQMRRNSVFQH